jgi:hypothetical protein
MIDYISDHLGLPSLINHSQEVRITGKKVISGIISRYLRGENNVISADFTS